MTKYLTLEDVTKLPHERVLELYRQGKTLQEDYRLEKLSPETATETLANLGLAMIGITVGSVIYYNLGKWLTIKLGWEK